MRFKQNIFQLINEYSLYYWTLRVGLLINLCNINYVVLYIMKALEIAIYKLDIQWTIIRNFWPDRLIHCGHTLAYIIVCNYGIPSSILLRLIYSSWHVTYQFNAYFQVWIMSNLIQIRPANFWSRFRSINFVLCNSISGHVQSNSCQYDGFSKCNSIFIRTQVHFK